MWIPRVPVSLLPSVACAFAKKERLPLKRRLCAIACLEFADEAVAIVGFQDPQVSDAVIQKLRSQRSQLKILQWDLRVRARLFKIKKRTGSSF